MLCFSDSPIIEVLHDNIFVGVNNFNLLPEMQAKFKLSVHRKNEYKKKRTRKAAALQSLPVEVVNEEEVDIPPVSLPNMQRIYFDASAPTLLQVRHRVQKTATFPKYTFLGFNFVAQ